jgi:hypothetical protein
MPLRIGIEPSLPALDDGVAHHLELELPADRARILRELARQLPPRR